MNPSDLEKRITAVEEQLTYLEAGSDALDRHVQRLNQLLESLELYCRKLETRISELENSGDSMPADDTEVPPHY